MDIWFIDTKRVWSIPDSVLPQVLTHLRASGADIVADALEVALDTGAVDIGMDDAEKPAITRAVEAWATEQEQVPTWATAIVNAP